MSGTTIFIFITVFSVAMISQPLLLKVAKNVARALCLAIMIIVKTIKVSEEIDYDRSLGVFRCR